MYKHYVHFIPKGRSPSKVKEIELIEIRSDSLDTEDIKRQAHNSATNNIDPYALRNHWEIFKIEPTFADTPWDTFEELCSDLMDHQTANTWRTVENIMYIMVDEGSESEYVQNIDGYFKPLSPRMSSSGVVEIQTKPETQ